MWYAAYSLTILLSAVHVPKVRAESSVTGDEEVFEGAFDFPGFEVGLEERLPAYTSRVPAREM